MSHEELQVWLNRVSRTFALTIGMLKEPFRTYASAAYLLCRVADTVEDSETLSTIDKCLFLRDFTGRLNESQSPDSPPASAPFPAPGTWDEQLTHHEPVLLALVRSFPRPVQDIVFKYVAEMAAGMAVFLEKKDAQGSLHFESDAQLDQYCYYVAGTVGLMMDGLFATICGTDRSAAGEVAVELGIGLQLTNIVKDTRKDRLRDIHYCPTGPSPHWPGTGPFQPMDDPSWKIRSLAGAAMAHLAGGMKYLLSLDSNRGQYKLFCITNYLMAWKTLEACLRNPLRTANEGNVRISRPTVTLTLLESRGCVASSRFLSWRVDRLRRTCSNLVLATTDR